MLAKMDSLAAATPLPASRSASTAGSTAGAAAVAKQQSNKEAPTALLIDVSKDPPLRSILRSPQEFKPRGTPAVDAAAAAATPPAVETSTARSALADDESWKRIADALPTPQTQNRAAVAEWETALSASVDSTSKGKQKVPPSRSSSHASRLPSPPGAMPVQAQAAASRQAYVEDVDEAKAASSRAPSVAASVKSSASKVKVQAAAAAKAPSAKASSRASSVVQQPSQPEVKITPPSLPTTAPDTLAPGTPTSQARSVSPSTQAAPNYGTSVSYPPSLSGVGGAASEFTGIAMPDKPHDMPDALYQSLRLEAQAQARRIVEAEMQKRGLAESVYTATEAFTDAETFRTAARQSEPPSHVDFPTAHVEPIAQPPPPPSAVPPLSYDAPVAMPVSAPTPEPMPMPAPSPVPPQAYWPSTSAEWPDPEAMVAAWRARSQELPPEAASALPVPSGMSLMDAQTQGALHSFDTSAERAHEASAHLPHPPPPPLPTAYAPWEGAAQPSPQPIMTPHEWFVRNGGGELPQGWVAEYDERYATWYFVDQSVYPSRSTWLDPRVASPPLEPRSRFTRRRGASKLRDRGGEEKRRAETMPGAYESWAKGWEEDASALQAARSFEAYEAAKQARGHRGVVAAELDRELVSAQRARSIYDEATEAPLRLVEAARRDDERGIVEAEERAARAAGARDRMRADDVARAAAMPVGLHAYEGPSRGWDAWGRERVGWMSAPGPGGGRPGAATGTLRTYPADMMVVGQQPMMQPDGTWITAAPPPPPPPLMQMRGVSDDRRFTKPAARPRVGLKGSHTPTPFGLPEAVFAMDMAIRASHATEALEGVYLGSGPYSGPPAASFPPNYSQRRALANPPYPS